MFYHLFIAWTAEFGFLRVFHYPTFRIPLATLTALAIMLVFFPRFIELLRDRQNGVDNVRADTPEQHAKKRGTPTMGGLFILVAVLVSSLLWADLGNFYVWIVLAVLVGFGAIGFVDDYRKVKKRDSRGLSGRFKLLWQVVILIAVTLVIVAASKGFLTNTEVILDTTLSLPFVAVKWFNPDIGWLYIPFAFLVVMGTSHAVNLTDGLDGLAIGPTVVSAATFLILAYIAGLALTFNTASGWVDFNVADYLNIPHIEGISEVSIVCAAIVGAGVGFLWYNTFPAEVFMGDVGSLALGGALGTIAVVTKNEIMSALIHGIFLAETVSVILQVGSFKLTGKRIFRMAPLHHHFELKGWAEPKIIVRFWIISIICALVALVSLKLR